MSAIASFTLIPESALDGLRDAAVPKRLWFGGSKDHFWNYLRQNGREAAHYEWSGYVLATLLPFLSERRQIDLMKSEYDDLVAHLVAARKCACFILSFAHKSAHLAKLSPELFSETDLKDYYNAFNETNEEDVGEAMLGGVRVLHESLGRIDDGSVVLLTIG